MRDLIGVLSAAALLAAAMMLSGCEPPDSASRFPPRQTAATAPAPQQVFHSERYGVTFAYPERGVHGAGGDTGYFNDPGWRVGAGPDEVGRRLLALQLDGSNAVTTGELRLGVSRAPEQVHHCTQPGHLARIEPTGTVTLDGVPFTTFRGGDAGMSHYQIVHAWRAVHQGVCYAIDLVVQGTSPQVYDPPRTPPFSKAQAFQRLRALLGGFAFEDH